MLRLLKVTAITLSFMALTATAYAEKEILTQKKSAAS